MKKNCGSSWLFTRMITSIIFITTNNMAKKYAVLGKTYIIILNTQKCSNSPIAEREGGAGAGTISATLHWGSGGAGANVFCCLHEAAWDGFRSDLVPDDAKLWSCSLCLATAMPTGMAGWTHYHIATS